MVRLLSLALVLLPCLSLGQLTCLPYQCKPASVQFPNNTCVVTDSGRVLLSPCDPNSGNSFCNVNTGKCVPPVKAPLQSYPGEPCNIQSDCQIGQCSNGICQGLGLSAKCSSSGQCAPGLFCASTGLCSQQHSVGSACSSDFDCVSYAGCVNNNCTEYYSLAVNSTVPDCSSTGLSNFCQKMTCLRTTWLGSSGKCVQPKTSYHAAPQQCTSNLNCTATDGVSNYTGTCACGYNEIGAAYCQPNLGDIQGMWLTQAYRNAVKRSAGKCNTARRLNQYCWEATGEWENVNTQYWNFYYLPLIQGNDKCVSQTFTRAYWSAAAAVLQVGVALGLLAVSS